MILEPTDTELRGRVLALFYVHRRKPWHESNGSDVVPPMPARDFVDICLQLQEHGLLDIKHKKHDRGSTSEVGAKITATGIDAVETKGERSPIMIVMPTFNFNGSQQVQIGSRNTQIITPAP